MKAQAELHPKIQPTHRERRAVVYLRQSTMRQVHEHHESTTRQYALRDRATELGWTADDIEVIDEDLGQSGSRSVLANWLHTTRRRGRSRSRGSHLCAGGFSSLSFISGLASTAGVVLLGGCRHHR